MISDLVVDVVAYLLRAALQGLSALVPSSLLGWFTSISETLSAILVFTPATSVFLLMGAWFALDTALNGYAFVWSVYRLLPAKFT